jgi:hypothetical protein
VLKSNTTGLAVVMRKPTTYYTRNNIMMVEVFKTNVQVSEDASHVIRTLSAHLPHSKINFDLDDCDKILRIEADHIPNPTVINVLNKMNYLCEVLPD